MKKTRDIDKIYEATLKADLILSDYTLTSDQDEKKIYLTLLERYIEHLDDPAATLYYGKIISATNDGEKEIYIEILIDILSNLKSKVPGYQE